MRRAGNGYRKQELTLREVWYFWTLQYAWRVGAHVSCATEVALIFAWVEGLPQLGAASAVETAPAWLGMQWCQEESGDQEGDGQTTPLVDKEEGSHWFSQTPCAAAGLERGTLSLVSLRQILHKTALSLGHAHEYEWEDYDVIIYWHWIMQLNGKLLQLKYLFFPLLWPVLHNPPL